MTAGTCVTDGILERVRVLVLEFMLISGGGVWVDIVAPCVAQVSFAASETPRARKRGENLMSLYCSQQDDAEVPGEPAGQFLGYVTDVYSCFS